jgi:hypothetical protein
MARRFHHVANGTSVTGTFEAAGIPGTSSIWSDVLYEGPVPGGLSDADLMDVRARFLGEPQDQPWNDLGHWRSMIERSDAYDELILWFEHDLFDQLNLIQLLDWIPDRVRRERVVSLICIGSFPGHPTFKGLGELMPQELGSLLDTRQPVTNAQYSLATRAWQAFREPSPEALDSLRRADTSALPFLAAALTRFLQEYPWTSDGLSRSERRLLELAHGDGIRLAAAFPKMDDGENAYYITDGSLVSTADALCAASPALLTSSGGAAGAVDLRHTSVAVTDTGRAVLARAQDRVQICGIDRWLGGVHLSGRNGLWRWDDTRGSIARQ